MLETYVKFILVLSYSIKHELINILNILYNLSTYREI